MRNTEFKKFLGDLFLGVSIFCSIIFMLNSSGVFSYAEKNYVTTQLWKTISDPSFKTDSVILIFGNSHSFYLNRNIIETETGYTTLHIGFPVANIESLYWLLYNVMQFVKPKLIILETKSLLEFRQQNVWNSISIPFKLKWKDNFTLTQFTQHSFSSHLIQIPWSFRKVYSLMNSSKRNIKAYPFLFTGSSVRNFHFTETKTNTLLEALFNSSPTENLNYGFVEPKYLPIHDTTLLRYESRQVLPSSKVNENGLDYARKFIDLCKENHMDVLLYNSPMFFKHFNPNSKYFFQIDSASLVWNVPYYNFNDFDTLTHNSSLFENTLSLNQHLTKEGADNVSSLLSIIIRDNINTTEAKLY